MKIPYLLAAAAACALIVTGCVKSENSKPTTSEPEELVSGITMPAGTQAFAPGNVVTVAGSGFAQGDVIVFRPVSGSDVQATVTGVSASGISFMIPDGLAAGTQSLILKRSGEELKLGELAVAANTLYVVGGDAYSLYTLNKSTAAATLVKALPEGQYMIDFVSAPGSPMLYGVTDEDSGAIGSLNITTKQFAAVGTVANFQNLCMVGSKLYALCIDGTGKVLLKEINPSTGALVQTTQCGTLTPPAGNDSYVYFEGTTAYYDAPSNSILATILKYDGTHETQHLARINLATNTLSSDLADNDYVCLYRRGGKLYGVLSTVINYDTPQESCRYDIVEVNLTTFSHGSSVGQFEGGFDSVVYDPSTATIFCSRYTSALWAFNLTAATPTLNKTTSATLINWLFVK